MAWLRLPLLRAFANPRFRTIIAAILLGAAATRMGLSLLEAYPNMTDFRTFFLPTTRLAWAGISPYHVITLSPHGRFSGPSGGSIYTPTFLVLMWPWTWLPDDAGRLLWTAIELASTGGILVLAARGLGGLTRTQLMVGAALMLVFPPLRDSINEGQISILLGFFVVAALFAAESGRARVAGICLGLAIAIKLTPVLFCAYFAWRRRWGALLWAGLTAIALSSLTLVVGWGGYWLPFVGALGQAGSGTANVLNQSLNGVLLRAYDARLDGFPIGPLPGLVSLMVVVASAAVIVALALNVSRGRLPGPEQPWADLSILLLVVPVLQPFAWTHHFAQAAVICPVAVAMVGRGRLTAAAGAALAGLYLVILFAYHGFFKQAMAAGADRVAADPLLQLQASLLFLAVVGVGVTWFRLQPRSDMALRFRAGVPGSKI